MISFLLLYIFHSLFLSLPHHLSLFSLHPWQFLFLPQCLSLSSLKIKTSHYPNQNPSIIESHMNEEKKKPFLILRIQHNNTITKKKKKIKLSLPLLSHFHYLTFNFLLVFTLYCLLNYLFLIFKVNKITNFCCWTCNFYFPLVCFGFFYFV